MSEAFETQTEEPVVEQSGSRGCLFGCLGAIVVMALLAICGGFGAYYFVTGQVGKYTSETPTELPKVEYSEEEIATLKQRIDDFKQALDNDLPSDDLVLTAEEINALINANEDLRGKAYVEIEDGLVTGDISVPTDMIPGGKGRFFNASATFDVKLENGVLVVTLADAEVKGEPVPPQVIEGLSQENLAKEVYKDPENAELIRKFESIEVQDDTIILKLRRPSAGAEAENSSKLDPPSDGEPADGEPADGEPADGEPADGEPADGEPADGEPADGETAVGEATSDP